MKTMKAIWGILLPGQRVEAGVLLALMVVGMVLELLGIGLVVPGLAVMVQDQSRLQSPIFTSIRDRLGDIPASQLRLLGLGIVLAVYLVKCVFLAFLAVRQAALVARVQTSVSERLFAGSLTQPWQFHLARNSADLIRNIDSVQGFTTTCTVLLMLMAESLVICGLIGLLIWCEPTGAIVVGVMLAASTLAYDRFTRTRLVRLGTLRYLRPCRTSLQMPPRGHRRCQRCESTRPRAGVCRAFFQPRFDYGADGGAAGAVSAAAQALV